MRKVILDTNFLMYCSENKIDYATELVGLVNEGFELVVPNLVVEELRDLSKKSKKYSDKEAANLSLKLLEHNEIKEIEIKAKDADSSIIKIAPGNFVATLDLILRRKLKSIARVIVINSKRKLAFA